MKTNPKQMQKLLFVCTGNTCRSPMAEGYFNFAVQSKTTTSKMVPATALSAGIDGFGDLPISENSLKVLQQQGIDLSLHTSRQLTNKMIMDADIVLTMTNSHLSFLLDTYPEFESRLFTLKGFALAQNSDIADPFGRDFSYYSECFLEIQECIDILVKEIFTGGKLIL